MNVGRGSLVHDGSGSLVHDGRGSLVCDGRGSWYMAYVEHVMHIYVALLIMKRM